MSLTPGTGRALMTAGIHRGVFMRISADEVIRLWTGRHKIRVAANDLDATPEIYTGFGVMRDLPELDRLLNGEARRVDFTLSGLNQKAAGLVDDAGLGLLNRSVRLGSIRFDRLWQPTGEMRWRWEGRLDVCGIQAEQSERGHTWTVNVSISTAFAGRNRPALKYWTPADMNLIYPTDKFYDNVPSYTEGTTRRFPAR